MQSPSAVAADAARNPTPYMNAAMKSHTEPAWAREGGYVPPSPPSQAYPGNDVEANWRNAPTVTEPGADMTEEELRDVKRANIVLRFLYMAVAVCMSAAAVLSFGGASFEEFFIAGYVCVFSGLMCCFETGFGFVSRGIAVNFGFMYSSFGRIIFNLFLAVMCYSLNTLFGLIDMCILVAILALHLFIMYKYPKYERYVRRTHYFAAKNAG